MEVAWMNQRVISILNGLISSLFGLESIRIVGMGLWLLSKTRILKGLVGKLLFVLIYKQGCPDSPSLHRRGCPPPEDNQPGPE